MDAVSTRCMPLVKVCAVTHVDEVKLLDALGVELAGLWCGIPQGRYNLDYRQLTRLATTSTQTLKFILVTLEHSMAFFDKCVENGHIHGVQLHGFQLPSLVKRLKATFGRNFNVLKVLHIQKGRCLEDALIERYLEAGADVLVLDRFLDPSRIGSTGRPLGNACLDAFVNQRVAAGKIMIAGGINEKNIAAICRDYRPFGVDIESAARKNGSIHKDRVARIMQQFQFAN